MSLYRKYRPQTFANLVGQNHVRLTLSNALKTGNVHHAYLFTGPRGTGKTSTARLMAKAINCLNLQDFEPCEKCDICRDISDGRLIDLIEIDAASNRGIDEIRDLRDKIQFSPTRAKSKVYIIDEVHMLTKEAFNALLKTLEEPPAHVYFILATTEVHKIPETILSRCQRFDFKRIDYKNLVERLSYIAEKEKIDAEISALELIATYVEGGLRDAIGLLEQLTSNNQLNLKHVEEILGISGKVALEKVYQFLNEKNVTSALSEINSLYEQGYDLNQFNKDFLELLRKKLLQIVSNNLDTSEIMSFINAFQKSYENLKFAFIPQLPLEIAIIESCVSNKTPVAFQENLIKEISEKRTHSNLSQRSFKDIKENWSQVAKNLKTVSARRLFPAITLLDLEENDLKIGFKTQFHLGKMRETENRIDFEETLHEIFAINLKICPELLKDNNEDAQKLVNVFGGEFV